MRAVLLVLPLTAVAACKADVPEGVFACDTDRDCPSSLACIDGFCGSRAGGSDAGVDAAGLDAAGVDTGTSVDGGDATDGSTDAPTPACPPLAERDRIELGGPIDTDTTWSCEHIYSLRSVVVVRPDATLTIGPGVRVEASPGAALVVVRDGRLVAEGSEGAPIELGPDEGEGNWGGIVLLGRAPVTGGAATFDTLPELAAPDATYGDDQPTYSCGSLQYVRIERAGADLDAGPLGALVLAGCGTGTVVEHVHVANAAEDGIEIYGGAVPLRWVIVTGAQKQGLDWDRGWTGLAQYLIVRSIEGDGGGIEGSTNATDTAVTPRSDPLLFNVTLLGNPGAAGAQQGIRLEARSRGEIHNSIVDGFRGPCVATDELVEDQYEGTEVPLVNSAVNACGGGLAERYRTFSMTFWESLDGTNHDAVIGGIDRETNDFIPDDSATGLRLTNAPPELEDAMYLGAVAPDDASPWYGWTWFD